MILSPDNNLTVGGVYQWTPQRAKWAWDKARRDFTQALKDRPECVVLLVGAPGSGKTTWLSANEKPGVLYFDAVFDAAWKRKPFIEEALAAGIPVHLVWVRTPLEVCLDRNARRSPDRQVPEEILRKMWGSLDKNPPNLYRGGCSIEVVDGTS